MITSHNWPGFPEFSCVRWEGLGMRVQSIGGQAEVEVHLFPDNLKVWMLWSELVPTSKFIISPCYPPAPESYWRLAEPIYLCMLAVKCEWLCCVVLRHSSGGVDQTYTDKQNSKWDKRKLEEKERKVITRLDIGCIFKAVHEWDHASLLTL